jgi:uncharacterized DUF497 family protein
VYKKSGMKIVWDEPKRLANLDKHGLDFADFEECFSWDDFLVFPVRPSRTGRARHQMIGTLADELVVVAIVSPLGTEALSLVSLRPASGKERTRYEQDT